MVTISKKHPIAWWFTGRPLDGDRRTNCTFWRSGTELRYPAPVRAWSYRPGWQRAAVRQLALIAAGAAVWARFTHPQGLAAVLSVLACWAVAGGAWWAWRAGAAWWRGRRYVRPLHLMLAPLLGLPSTVRAEHYITVPATFRTNEATPVRIILPKQFVPTAANREQIAQAVLPKLGMNADTMDVDFRVVGNPVAVFTMAPQPPKTVMWADELAQLAALRPGQIFVGRGARGTAYVRDFGAGEVVHGGFNGQTGSGKSNAVVGWCAQFLRADPDTQVTFVDPKQSTLPTCLVGVPGYTLANNPDDVSEMWRVIEEFEAEMDRRRAARLADPTLEFPFMYLILDELSEFADLSRELWEEIKSKEDRKTPRIWRSIARLMRMGREFGVRVLVFTQRLDSASTGGFGLRDLLGWRGLSKFKRNHWMMLVGTTPIPKAINHVGRWIYTDGDTEKWVQNIYGTAQQFRDWALGLTPRTEEATRPASVASTLTEQGQGTRDNGTNQDTIVGLQAGADYLGISFAAFKARRTRAERIDGEFKVGNQPAWTPAVLDEFNSVGASK